jgi:hypothetical protein
MRSFDAPRDRPAPPVLRGRTPEGEDRSIEVREWTLVVAVKPHCDGCRAFIEGDLHELEQVSVVLVSKTPYVEWRTATQPVLVAPAIFADLEIRAAPFYVLIDPRTLRVVAEGSLFSPAQVASEIAPYLTAAM